MEQMHIYTRYILFDYDTLKQSFATSASTRMQKPSASVTNKAEHRINLTPV